MIGLFNMKNYASKQTHKGRTAYRTPSRFIYKNVKKKEKTLRAFTKGHRDSRANESSML